MRRVNVSPASLALLIVLAAPPLATQAEDAQEAEYQRRWKAAANSVARQQRFAARWCADNGLEGAATNEWEESLLLEPDSEDARKALGFARKKGEWVRDEDFAVERENRGDTKEIGEALDTYRKKRLGIVSAAERDLVPLALWTTEKGFKERAKRLWTLVRLFDPGNADACEAIGWKEAGGRWYPEAEAASRKAALDLLESGDGGKAVKEASEVTAPMEAKFERRRSAHFTFEGRATQEQLAKWLRGAEATRTLMFELLAPDEQLRPAGMTGVFLTSNAEHARFLEKCTPMSEDERETYKSLGGWTTFTPSIVFELWTKGEFPEYHREASIHIAAHMLFQGTWGIAKPAPWLSEGFALWFTDRLTGSALARCTDLMGNTIGDDRSPSTAGWRARLRARLREASAPSLRSVFRAHADDLDLDKNIVSWSFVSFLASQPELFRQFVKRVAGKEDETDALFETLGAKDYDAIQAKWEAWVRDNS
ncbi:MAG: hypothetical protein AAB074_12525 [Planctomycetota bacterium]